MYYLPHVRVPVLVCVHREVTSLCLCPTCSIGSLVPEELMTLIIFRTLLSTIKRLSWAGQYGRHHAVFAFSMCGFAAISWPVSCGLCLGSLPQSNISELRSVFRHDRLPLKGNESCSSFQGRGVGMMRFLTCVCVCVLRPQQMCLPLWICTLFFNARFKKFANWKHFFQSSDSFIRGVFENW